MAAALVAFLSGVLLLFSVALPPEFERLESIREWLPLFVVEGSHLIGSIIGVALLLVARGLLRRLSAAWLLTEILLLVGAAAALLKGLDWEEATAAPRDGADPLSSSAPPSIAAARSRRSASRRAGWRWRCRRAIAAAWLGFFANRHVDYSQELWWQFAWHGNAPRFLRATVVVAAVARLGGGRSLHAPRLRGEVRARSRDRRNPPARRGVALDADERRAPRRQEVPPERRPHGLPHVRPRPARAGSRWAIPSGPEAAAPDLIWAFRELADRAGGSAVYYAVGQTYLPVYIDMGLSILKIGEVARVALPTFTLEGIAARRLPPRRPARWSARACDFAIIPKAEVPQHIEALRRRLRRLARRPRPATRRRSRSAISPRCLSVGVRLRGAARGRGDHRLRQYLAERGEKRDVGRPDALPAAPRELS